MLNSYFFVPNRNHHRTSTSELKCTDLEIWIMQSTTYAHLPMISTKVMAHLAKISTRRIAHLPKISIKRIAHLPKISIKRMAHLPKISTRRTAHLPKISQVLFNVVARWNNFILMLKKGLGSVYEGPSAWVARLMPYLITRVYLTRSYWS